MTLKKRQPKTSILLLEVFCLGIFMNTYARTTQENRTMIKILGPNSQPGYNPPDWRINVKPYYVSAKETAVRCLKLKSVKSITNSNWRATGEDGIPPETSVSEVYAFILALHGKNKWFQMTGTISFVWPSLRRRIYIYELQKDQFDWYQRRLTLLCY